MIKPPPFVRVFPPFVRIFPPFWTSSRWPPGDGSDNPPRSASLTPPDNDNGDAFSRRQTACYRVEFTMAASPYRLEPRLAFCFLLRVLVLREKNEGGNSKGSGCVSALVWLLLSLIFLKILFYSIFLFLFYYLIFLSFLDR